MKIKTRYVTTIQTKASEVFDNFVQSYIDHIKDEPQEESFRKQELEVVRRMLFKGASQLEVETFFNDGYTMMALSEEIFSFIDRDIKDINDMVLDITDDNDKILYSINGKYLQY